MDINLPAGLTLEQKFSLRSFEAQVEKMSREQAQKFLVELYGHMMAKESMYQAFLKREWGISAVPEVGE